MVVPQLTAAPTLATLVDYATLDVTVTQCAFSGLCRAPLRVLGGNLANMDTGRLEVAHCQGRGGVCHFSGKRHSMPTAYGGQLLPRRLAAAFSWALAAEARADLLGV